MYSICVIGSGQFRYSPMSPLKWHYIEFSKLIYSEILLLLQKSDHLNDGKWFRHLQMAFARCIKG